MIAIALPLPFAFLNLGPMELVLILFLMLLLFGAKRLPELAKGMGKAIREFKKAASEAESDIRDAVQEQPKSSAPKPPASTPPPANN
jgi:sec-independent protein translocase protein TatA